MAAKKGAPNLRPATTPEGRENQLISLAYDLAEKQLREGTASSQMITHLLKAASTRDQLEKEKIQRENLLLSAKVDSIAAGQRIEEMYKEALKAMKQYSGQDISEFDES